MKNNFRLVKLIERADALKIAEDRFRYIIVNNIKKTKDRTDFEKLELYNIFREWATFS